MNNLVEEKQENYKLPEKIRIGTIRITIKFLQWFGSLIIALSIAYFFIGSNNMNVSEHIFIYSKLIISILGFLLGLFSVVIGQLIKCLIGIYDNTYELSKLFHKQLKTDS